MLLDTLSHGPAPRLSRISVAPNRSSAPGVRVRYAIDRAAWLWDTAEPLTAPSFVRFRLEVQVKPGEKLHFQFSADQFAVLYMDGHWLTRGPDVGAPWFYGFSEYEVAIEPGLHVLEALVWWIGHKSPGARMSVRAGFAMAGCNDWQDRLTTGVAPWKVARVEGMGIEPLAKQAEVLTTGANGLVDAAAFFAAPPQWSEPVIVTNKLSESAHGTSGSDRTMEPSNLPEMPIERQSPGRICAVGDWTMESDPVPACALDSPEIQAAIGVLRGNIYTVPAKSRRLLVWDLGNYYSGFPEVCVSGGKGAVIRQTWTESFYLTESVRTKKKGHRDEIVGKYLTEGLGDRFLPDGREGLRMVPYWWRCGRYCLVEITTADEPVSLTGLSLLISGHPFDWVGSFRCDEDERLQPILNACRRTLEVSSWDTYQDSPYFEQLMYIGDTRLEVLVTYVLNGNDSLPRRALDLLDSSRLAWQGLVASRFPCRGNQLIASFCLKWVLMVHDYCLWRADAAHTARMLPGIRHILEHFCGWMNKDGLIEGVHGWPYVDWVSSWPRGIPTAAVGGVCALHNLVFLLALQAAAEIEDACGQPELAALNRRRARSLKAAIRATYFDAETGCLADDPSHQHWSQHAQIYGILSGVLNPEEGSAALDKARTDERFVVPSYVFRFYLFEAMRKLGRAGEILGEMQAWQDMINQGAVTVWEQLEPTRSDCHAWSSHPLFHLPTSVLGIRPGLPGFARVDIEPQPGPLKKAHAVVAHPKGAIDVRLDFNEDGGCSGQIQLPEGVPGVLRYGGREVLLQPGAQAIG